MVEWYQYSSCFKKYLVPGIGNEEGVNPSFIISLPYPLTNSTLQITRHCLSELLLKLSRPTCRHYSFTQITESVTSTIVRLSSFFKEKHDFLWFVYFFKCFWRTFPQGSLYADKACKLSSHSHAGAPAGSQLWSFLIKYF